MSDSSLFTLEIVQEFIVSRGGKVRNHDLVTHFKSFLNDPKKANKNANRQKFKEYVNTLATIKLDESGEKMLVLKRKYQSFEPDAPKQAKQAKKLDGKAMKSKPTGAAMFENMATEEKTYEPKSFQEELPPLQKENFESQPSEPEHPVFQRARSQETILEEPEEEDVALPRSSSEPLLDERNESKPVPELVLPAYIDQPTQALEPQTDSEPQTESEPQMDSEPSPPEPSPPEPSKELDTGDMASPPNSDVVDAGPSEMIPQTPIQPEEANPVAKGPPMSVKERAKHLNKMSSESDLLKNNTPKKEKKQGENDEGQPSHEAINLTAVEREWLITAAKADYHPLNQLLSKNPQLAKRKDFTSGFTALHWAAKHGKIEVVKLIFGTAAEHINVNTRSHGGYTPLHLAAMNGHEEIIGILIQTYGADPNIRDYSGKKPKQYLRSIRDTRIQQLLTKRRESLVTSMSATGPAPFRRVGSYSTKIRSSGFFGFPERHRNSLAVGTSGRLNRPSASPSSSRSPSPRVRRRGSAASSTGSNHSSPGMPRKGSLQDAQLMPPPNAPPRRHRSGKENVDGSDSDIPRTASDPELLRASAPAELEQYNTLV